MSKIIAPSILAGDFANLGRVIEMVNASKADWLHIDIMDGVFVPNISFGMPVLEAIKQYTEKPLDVHLMIVEPERYIARFAELGADVLSIHYEASPHLHRSLQAIKENGMNTGVAVNPHTNVMLLEDVIHEVDVVCLMSVNPGFGGQQFIKNTYKKVRQLKEMILDCKATTKIEIDGGVTDQNIEKLVDAGADIFVAGSHVFKSEKPIAAIETLYTLANS